MARTVTDWKGHTVKGALEEVPPKWYADESEDVFWRYQAGVDNIYAIIEPDTKRGGWMWALHVDSIVPCADNEYAPRSCASAQTALNAVRRAAKKHKVAWLV